jgi:hypothetical protein
MSLLDYLATPRIKYGLLAGCAGLLLTSLSSYLFGICGTLVGLLAGSAAGFLTSRKENELTPQAASRAGMVSGSVAGILVLLGQLIGTAISIAVMQNEQLSLIMQVQPAGTSLQSVQGFYWSSGLGFGFCLGLTGLVFSVLAGGAVSYLISRRNLPSR